MSNQDVEQRIKQFITTNFYVAEPASLTPRDSFFERGIVDSTGVLEVVSFLEETFGITVRDNEMLPENLDSLQGLNDFVEQKLTTRSPLRLVSSEEPPPTPSPLQVSPSLTQPVAAQGEDEPV